MDGIEKLLKTSFAGAANQLTQLYPLLCSTKKPTLFIYLFINSFILYLFIYHIFFLYYFYLTGTGYVTSLQQQKQSYITGYTAAIESIIDFASDSGSDIIKVSFRNLNSLSNIHNFTKPLHL